jgi:hypothetical protein
MTLATVFHGATSAAAIAGSCRTSPKVVAPCWTIHATLQVANGSPGLRLHPHGSRRILGVFDRNHSEEGAHVVPANVEAAATPPRPGEWNPVEGDYRVCPLARRRLGWMQPICIDQAWRLHARPRTAGSPYQR